MKKPLEGIRVLDLGHVLAMPTCTMQLADLGAEVIKIERPGTGDDSRNFGPFINNESAYFISINRNKKSITLDLKKEKDKKIFKNLVKISDVVTENYRPNTMQKLGLGYEVLKEINPKIIYASTPIKLSLTTGKVETASPLLGQHTEEILKELLGFSKGKINSLKKEGVV